MLQRRGLGLAPRLTFTSDFHELLAGDRVPGKCLLRYDPFRIVPADEFDASRPVTMHVKQHPSGALWERSVSVSAGRLKTELYDAAGQGFMIEESFDLLDDTEVLEIWASYIDAHGGQRWDSDGGNNFWLRFPIHDLTINRAALVDNQNATDWLQLEVASAPAVESLTVRWRATKPAGLPRREVALVAAPGPAATLAWQLPVAGAAVPHGATVVFDLVYLVTGREYTDDNQGTWYLAER